MQILLILALIVLLYFRVKDNFWNIDDNVAQEDYLYKVPIDGPDEKMFDIKAPTIVNLRPIVFHLLNTTVIWHLWGWPAALIYAIHPVNANFVAWKTGCYYGITTFLALSTYLVIHDFPNVFGAILGSVLFYGALESTITAISLPFVFLLTMNPYGFGTFISLMIWLKGDRWKKGKGVRENLVQSSKIKDSLNFKKIPYMTKIVGYYILISLVPYVLAFFRMFGHFYLKDEKVYNDCNSYNHEFWLSLAMIVLLAYLGWQTNWLATCLFFCLIMPFNQWKILGQSLTERYLGIPIVGVSILLASWISPYPILFAIYATMLLYRTHLYIPTLSHIVRTYRNGIEQYPDCSNNYNNLSVYYVHRQQPVEGLKLCENALDVYKNDYLIYANIACCWAVLGNIQESLAWTNKAFEIGKGNMPDWNIENMESQKKELTRLIEEQKQNGGKKT